VIKFFYIKGLSEVLSEDDASEATEAINQLCLDGATKMLLFLTRVPRITPEVRYQNGG
jgi:hypothetical protein